MMNIQIDGQGLTVTPALKELTIKKLNRSLMHFERIINVHVVLKAENEAEQTASADVSLPGAVVNAHAKSEDMYKTIDLMAHNLQTQLKKYKQKHESHRG